jgi:hypothetical protein
MRVQSITPSVYRFDKRLFHLQNPNRKSYIGNRKFNGAIQKKRGVIAIRVTAPDHGEDPEEEITPILSISIHACTAMETRPKHVCDFSMIRLPAAVKKKTRCHSEGATPCGVNSATEESALCQILRPA